MTAAIVLKSTITCPHCSHRRAETMPTDACFYFYVCQGCGRRLRPKTGECCIFCSYAGATSASTPSINCIASG